MKFTIFKYIILLIILSAFFFSCSPYKHISKNGKILSKNKVSLNSKELLKEDFQSLIKQDPNSSFFGMKIGMYIYSLSASGQDSTVGFISKSIIRPLGQKPVEYDPNFTFRTKQEMEDYLKIKGCFKGNVYDSIKKVRKWYAPWSYYKKRVASVYYIDAGIRYKIDTFTYKVKDTNLYPLVSRVIKDFPINKNSYYDEVDLTTQRFNITKQARESGYFGFSEEYISYVIDTNRSNNRVKIKLIIDSPKKMFDDSTYVQINHKAYKYRRIYIYPDYSSQLLSTYSDTTFLLHRQKKGMGLNQYYFIYNNTAPIKRKPILRSILFQKDSMFSPVLAERTYNSLFQLRNFKFVDISYAVPSSINIDDKDTIPLDCYIKLILSKPVSLSTSLEANFSAVTNAMTPTNTSNLGTEMNLGFQHKNILKGAEIFSSNLKFALEIRSDIFKKGNDTVNTWSFVNSFETGVDFGLDIPRFLIPFGTKFYSMQFKPHTSIKTGYNIQRTSYFERSIFNLNYGYTWNTMKKSYAIVPIEINLVKMNITDEAYAQRIQMMDRRIRYQYSDHFVMNARYSYIYNGQDINKKIGFNYFRFNIETAGNALYMLGKAANLNQNNAGSYLVFNIPFSQYIRSDVDIKKYIYFNQKKSLIFRAYAGIGVPYGNVRTLPYEKSFFGGGANNHRAWQLRQLGPGSAKQIDEAIPLDHSGDMTIGGNIEYRFPLFSIIEGATFIDMGNIWTLKELRDFEGGKFKFNSFYKEIATGVGVGLRVNIQFLLIRLDFAVKAYDPSQDSNNRWVLNKTKLNDVNLNLGIGYPF